MGQGKSNVLTTEPRRQRWVVGRKGMGMEKSGIAAPLSNRQCATVCVK